MYFKILNLFEKKFRVCHVYFFELYFIWLNKSKLLMNKFFFMDKYLIRSNKMCFRCISMRTLLLIIFIVLLNFIAALVSVVFISIWTLLLIIFILLVFIVLLNLIAALVSMFAISIWTLCLAHLISACQRS